MTNLGSPSNTTLRIWSIKEGAGGGYAQYSKSLHNSFLAENLVRIVRVRHRKSGTMLLRRGALHSLLE